MCILMQNGCHYLLDCLINQNFAQVEGALKSGIKEYMRRIVKTEILAKFTDWRRRFYEIFSSVDSNADGAVVAVSFVSFYRLHTSQIACIACL